MKKLLLIIVLAAMGFGAYILLSDPQRRDDILGTIENSTGVEISRESAENIKEGAQAIGDKASKVMKELGSTLSDPQFQKSLKKWGKDALEKLDEKQLKRLKKDLEGDDVDFDSVLEKYL